MRRQERKHAVVTYLMADGTVLHPGELKDYDFDPATISPVALRIIADLILNPTHTTPDTGKEIENDGPI